LKALCRAAALVCGLLAAGCHYSFDPEGTGCDGERGCPSGFSCGPDLQCHAQNDADSGVDGGSGNGSGMEDAGVSCNCAKPECAGQLCRAASGACDVAEYCTGGSCPPDAKSDAGVICSAASCSGSSALPPKTCDGAGACKAGAARECSPYGCDSDGGCFGPCTSTATCASGNYCNSSKACVAQLDNGLACAGDDGCLSGHCVDGFCCNAACAGECDACNLTGFIGECKANPKGFVGAPVCAHYTCDGTLGGCPTGCVGPADCVAGDYCNSANKCVVRKPDGQPCSASLQCANGNCVDGVCCNSACAGGCDVCNAAGSMGLCSALDAGTASPSCAPYRCGGGAACPMSCMGAGDCTAGVQCVNGLCGGKLAIGQACIIPTDCFSGNCVDGFCCTSGCGGACDRCDLGGNQGTCTFNVGASNAGCGSYVCGNAAACPTSCQLDSECSTGNYCTSSHLCVPKLSTGAACAGNNQCSGGNCVEGFCCNSTCSGNCQTCKASLGAPSNGTCGNVTALTDPKNGCAGYFCNGAGNCATACSGSCQTSCKSGAFCNGSNCVAQLATGGACSQTCQCSGGASCTSFFEDADLDSYGNPAVANKRSFCGVSPPVGYAMGAGDCCDSDADAHPGQTAWFATKVKGCLGFDFDCSGGEKLELIGIGGFCLSHNNGMGCDTYCDGFTTQPGWYGSVPACGVVGAWLTGVCTTSSIDDPPYCSPQYSCTADRVENSVQRCH
jgi:hypothetical protein